MSCCEPGRPRSLSDSVLLAAAALLDLEADLASNGTGQGLSEMDSLESLSALESDPELDGDPRPDVGSPRTPASTGSEVDAGRVQDRCGRGRAERKQRKRVPAQLHGGLEVIAQTLPE